jgi:hypothetical protein
MAIMLIGCQPAYSYCTCSGRADLFELELASEVLPKITTDLSSLRTSVTEQKKMWRVPVVWERAGALAAVCGRPRVLDVRECV